MSERSTHGVPAGTSRLVHRRACEEDAAFIHSLMNQPDWLRFIGDRGIRSDREASAYLAEQFIPAYARQLGFWVMQDRASGAPLGICGLARRPWLDREDLGFAVLEAFRGRGYAAESAAAIMDHARDVIGLDSLFAFCVPSNGVSVRLLRRLGFSYRSGEMTPDGQSVAVYETRL